LILLGVDADHWQPSFQVLLPQSGDLLELRVTIVMVAHGLLLLCLAPAVAVLPEQLGHYVAAHRSTQGAHPLGEIPKARREFIPGPFLISSEFEIRILTTLYIDDIL
jgi:hypothetical protein